MQKKPKTIKYVLYETNLQQTATQAVTQTATQAVQHLFSLLKNNVLRCFCVAQVAGCVAAKTIK
jgi:hypothetical protein